MPEEKMSEFEGIWIDISQAEKQTKKQKRLKKNRIFEKCGTTTKGVTHM